MFNPQEVKQASDFIERFEVKLNQAEDPSIDDAPDIDLVDHAEYNLARAIVSHNTSGHLDEFVGDCFKELRQLTNEEYYYPFWLHVADDDADIPHCYEEDPREGYNLADDWNEYDSPF